MFEHFLRTLNFIAISHGCRLPILYVPPRVYEGRLNQHHTVYNVLLVDNWMFRFLSFKFIFDLVAYKDRVYFGIYLSAKINRTLFTWREGNPAGGVTLLVGLPSSIVFPGFVYMRGRVTPGGGNPTCLLGLPF